MTARCLLLAALLPGCALAADLTAVFPQLTPLKLENEGIRVLYAKDQAEKVTQRPSWINEVEQAGVYAALPLRLQLGKGIPPLTLYCDSGPSADPSCRLLPNTDVPEKTVFDAPGTEFAFPGDGRIVVAGHSNNYYDQRKVFHWDGSKFVETVQPLLQVGLKGKTRAAIPLRSAPGATAATTGVVLPAGSSVTVLLNDNSTVDDSGQNPNYLLLSAEGIVGWAYLPGQPDGSTAIEGLFYAGD